MMTIPPLEYYVGLALIGLLAGARSHNKSPQWVGEEAVRIARAAVAELEKLHDQTGQPAAEGGGG